MDEERKVLKGSYFKGCWKPSEKLGDIYIYIFKKMNVWKLFKEN